jgi:hypothetical protein
MPVKLKSETKRATKSSRKVAGKKAGDVKSATKKSKQPKVKTAANEFSGRVERIVVRANGSDSEQVQFLLGGKKSGDRVFSLSRIEPTKLSAAVSLVTAAFVVGRKLHVRTSEEANEAGVAVEIELGRKS